MQAYSYYRISTLSQEDGDGLRRQEEGVVKYCKRMGLTLTGKKMKDIGLSGYHAIHLKRGALGVFVEALKVRKIKTPCALVIEHLDRLSRQDPMQSLPLLWEIVRAGVEVHTTMNGGRIYTATMGRNEMMDSIYSLCGGHEESQKKSDRGKELWAEKQANAHTQIMTRACPAWLKPKADMTGFTVLKARADILKEIFEMTAKGIGKTKIVDHLMAKGVKPWGRGIRWHASYIQKLMANPNVMGHLQTGSWVDGKHVINKKLIEKYYPQVITQAQWDAAHASRAARTPQFNRYDPKVPRDLIAGLLYINGLKAAWRNHGKRRPHLDYSIKYKTFDSETGKSVHRVRREQIEAVLLIEIAEIDPKKLVADPPSDPEANQIKELEVKIASLGKGIDRMIDSLASGLTSTAISKRIVESEKSVERAIKQLAKIKKDTTELDRANTLIPETIQSINELTLTDDDPAVRQAVSRQLHEIIERVDYYVGLEAFPNELRKEYKNYNPAVHGKTEKEDYTAFCLTVKFINGRTTSRVAWYTSKAEYY